MDRYRQTKICCLDVEKEMNKVVGVDMETRQSILEIVYIVAPWVVDVDVDVVDVVDVVGVVGVVDAVVVDVVVSSSLHSSFE